MEVAENPTKGLTLPAVRGRRDRIARPQEAAALIETLELADRAIYATALYAGLRRGELRGLRWTDVDFERNLIRVERAWDDRAGEIEPSSGRRADVPVSGAFRNEPHRRGTDDGSGHFCRAVDRIAALPRSIALRSGSGGPSSPQVQAALAGVS